MLIEAVLIYEHPIRECLKMRDKELVLFLFQYGLIIL